MRLLPRRAPRLRTHPVPLALVLALCLPLPACTREPARTDAPKTSSAMSTPDPTTVTDAPPARVGAHGFRFPAHAYADQHGPYDDGSVALVLLWPSLAPAAAGAMPARGTPGHDARLRIGLAATDPADPQASLTRLVQPDPAEPAQREDPARNPALRREGAPVHGLVPYTVDADAARAFLQRQSGTDAPAAFAEVAFTDLYLARDGSRLATVIACDDAQVPDGLREAGGTLVRDPDADAVAMCAHHLLAADDGVLVSIDYPRALLGHWRRIEDAARAFVERHRAH